MIKTQVTDGMELYIRAYTEDGNLVRGHYSRCAALRHEWDILVSQNGMPRKSVYVFDGTGELYDLHDGNLAVGILDTINQNNPRYDIVVSHHPGAYLFDLGENGHQLKLLGPEYLLMRPEYQKLNATEKGYIAYVPGGNHLQFWRNVGEVTRHHPGIIVENYAPSESAKIIAAASLVVCSASTVALEAMALGKRILMTQTSDDQQPIIDGLYWLGYRDFEFTPELMRNWRKLNPIQLGNRWGAREVASTIYKEANK